MRIKAKSPTWAPQDSDLEGQLLLWHCIPMLWYKSPHRVKDYTSFLVQGLCDCVFGGGWGLVSPWGNWANSAQKPVADALIKLKNSKMALGDCERFACTGEPYNILSYSRYCFSPLQVSFLSSWIPVSKLPSLCPFQRWEDWVSQVQRLSSVLSPSTVPLSKLHSALLLGPVLYCCPSSMVTGRCNLVWFWTWRNLSKTILFCICKGSSSCS